MTSLQLKGCGTALVTPFKNGEVDYVAYASLVKRQVESGIHFLVPLGTTAETPCLTENEKVELLKITNECAPDKIIVAGVGTNSFEHTKENISLLSQYRVDAFLVVTPYYNKPTQKGLYEYFWQLADFSPKPLVLYNVPGRTGVNLAADTTLALAQHPNIIAIKEASGNYAQISRIISGAPEGFYVLSGNDDETLSLMATGADGVISVVSNVAPKQMVKFTESLLDDNMPLAREYHHKLFELFKNCFMESNPIPAKEALAIMGLIRNELRLPLTTATDNTREIMKSTLTKLDLL